MESFPVENLNHTLFIALSYGLGLGGIFGYSLWLLISYKRLKEVMQK